MTQAYGQKRSHLEPLSSIGGTPFLARFAERRDDCTILGSYDESADVWVVNRQPLAIVDGVALQTMTTTRVAGESQDSD